MANNQDSGGEFRPFLADDFRPNTYIRAGAASSSPYARGVQDLAYNHNTMLARIKHNIVNQFDSPDTPTSITYVATPIVFAKYIVYVPPIPGRTDVTVYVNATTTGGTTFQVRGTTAAGTGSYSSATASGSTATVTVPVTTGTFQLMDLTFRLNAGGNFLPSFVHSFHADIATTAIGTTVNSYFTPQDSSVQYAVDSPLAVIMARDLVKANNNLFKFNMRAVCNWSQWGDWSSLVTTDAGLSQDGSVTKSTEINQFFYMARPGVTNLKIFLAGRTESYSSTGGEVYFSFDGEEFEGVAFNTATTATADSAWALWGGSLPVPQTGGPMYLKMYMKTPDGATTTNLQAFAVYEDYDTVTI